MRQTIGGTWILQLMILFMLIFVGFIVLTLNYSKSIRVKNEVISMVEKYEGLNEQSIKLINTFLETSGYVATGNCSSDTGVYGARDLTLSKLEPAESKTKYYYCVKKYRGANITRYYQITVFYKFNLPVIGSTSSFAVKGTTSNFVANDDELYQNTIGD